MEDASTDLCPLCSDLELRKHAESELGGIIDMEIVPPSIMPSFLLKAGKSI